MSDLWDRLIELGVPDGAVRAAGSGPIEPQTARALLQAALSSPLANRQRETLFAWLRAWKKHWPTSFAATFGDDGERALVTLEEGGLDANRYLKLRRIAIANLSERL